MLFAISGQTVKSHAITNPAEQFGATDYRTAEIDMPISTATDFAFDKLSEADIDLDGVISPLDALTFVNGMMAEQSEPLFDFNNDGHFSSVDAEWVIGKIGARPPRLDDVSAATTDVVMEIEFGIASPLAEP